jgi:hypothetical protein
MRATSTSTFRVSFEIRMGVGRTPFLGAPVAFFSALFSSAKMRSLPDAKGFARIASMDAQPFPTSRNVLFPLPYNTVVLRE